MDIVICNAAVLYFAHTMELTADELQRAMNVNIMGILYVRICFMQNLLDSGEQNNCYLMWSKIRKRVVTFHVIKRLEWIESYWSFLDY